MTFYKDLSQQQVTSLHKLLHFLRRLRIIGKVSTTTISSNIPTDPLDFALGGTARKYSVRYDGYSSDRSEMDIEEQLEKIFGRLSSDPSGNHFEF